MTQDEQPFTSVLLPAATVALFSRDKDIRESFEALATDWRFARVKLDVIEGDVETAISHYGSHAAPDLVIVQTEDINDGFSDRLEALGGKCSDQTDAIVIGPVNDVNLYRRLISMGVRDYLVKPVPTSLLAEDIAQTLLTQLGTSDSRVIAVMGAKGGVGATVISEALAHMMAEEMDQKTFILDAAGGWSTLSVGLSFEPATTLAEATRAAAEQNEDALTRMIHKAGEKMFVLSSGGDVMLEDNVDLPSFETLLDYVMGLYPVVIIDLSGATADLKRTALSRAHEIMLVATPTLPCIRASRTLLQEIKELRGGREVDVDIILNMKGVCPKYEVAKQQIEEGLEKKISVAIPYNPDLFIQTEMEAKSLASMKGGAEILKPFTGLMSERLSLKTPGGKTASDDAGLSSFLKKLTKAS